ncbi:hypothetical protein [Mycoplasma hafezii]|uniref:hypothetical protein n=1 Tax=Mycoplasma hafezii TaxID=525886 RepID=UPI003CF7C277
MHLNKTRTFLIVNWCNGALFGFTSIFFIVCVILSNVPITFDDGAALSWNEPIFFWLVWFCPLWLITLLILLHNLVIIISHKINFPMVMLPLSKKRKDELAAIELKGSKGVLISFIIFTLLILFVMSLTFFGVVLYVQALNSESHEECIKHSIEMVCIKITPAYVYIPFLCTSIYSLILAITFVTYNCITFFKKVKKPNTRIAN